MLPCVNEKEILKNARIELFAIGRDRGGGGREKIGIDSLSASGSRSIEMIHPCYFPL